MHQHQNDNAPEDVRVKVVSTIWGCAVGMLGICIPLVAISRTGPILPLLVIVGAAVATAIVWSGNVNAASTRSDAANEQKEMDELRKRVAELEERLSNVETIDRFEHHLAEKTLKGAGGTPVAGWSRESTHRESPLGESTRQETTYQVAERV